MSDAPNTEAKEEQKQEIDTAFLTGGCIEDYNVIKPYVARPPNCATVTTRAGGAIDSPDALAAQLCVWPRHHPFRTCCCGTFLAGELQQRRLPQTRANSSSFCVGEG